MLTTPTSITDSISTFCEQLVPASTPIWVEVEPDQFGEIDNCFDVVDSAVTRQGGRRQDGWLIWEWPGVLLEAIFHAVYVEPEGSLVDVTPKEDRERRILFLADPSQTYQGVLLDSRHFPLMASELVDEYVEVAKAMTGVRRSISPDGLGRVPEDEWIALAQRTDELRKQIQSEADQRAALQAVNAPKLLISVDDEGVRNELAACHDMARNGNIQGAMDRCLQLVDRNRSQFREPVRQFMLTLFKTLSDQPGVVSEYRRRLATVLN